MGGKPLFFFSPSNEYYTVRRSSDDNNHFRTFHLGLWQCLFSSFNIYAFFHHSLNSICITYENRLLHFTRLTFVY